MVKFSMFAALLSLGCSAPAHAGNAIVAWVSGMGVNSTSCGPIATPCRTFQYAHDSILGPAGGDILIHDAGSFGQLSIAKPVAVINDGVGTAGMGAPANGTAITINTAGAVVLRGLTIDGSGVASTGVSVSAASNLTIDNCLIRNFTGVGVYIAPTGSLAYSIANSTITGNQTNLLATANGGGTYSGMLSHANLTNSGIGIFLGVVSGVSQLSIADTQLSSNGTGLFVDGAGALALVRRTTIAWNNVGYHLQAGGIGQSYGDNTINGNASNTGVLQLLPSN